MAVTSRESTEAFDRLFLLATAFLIIGGIVILASASMPLSMKEEGYPYEYVNKQLFAISLGLIGGSVAFFNTYTVLGKIRNIFTIDGIAFAYICIYSRTRQNCEWVHKMVGYPWTTKYSGD